MRELSAKMPAMVDATLPSRDPATMPSDSQMTGDGGSDDAPDQAISRDTQRDASITWENLNEQTGDWQAMEAKSGGTWENANDVETPEGGLPQRDPDDDGDLN